MKKIDVSNPLALSKIIASEGLTNQIPADASSVAEQYNASQDVGFPEVTMKPVEIGGEAPDGRDFNGFLQLLSSHLFASQNGGIYTFSADVSSAIGGYPQGAILGYIDTNGDYNFVKSLIDDNTYNFVTNPEYIDNTHWERIVYPGAANTDLSNLTLQGKNIANWSSNVSNCTTEILQDIKLELNNGTLTIKAGGKVYVPNGAGVFDEIVINSDKTASISSFSGFVFYRSDNNSLHLESLRPTSGTTPPSGDGTWYDTNANKIKRYENSSFAYDGISFPLCKCSSGSIDQVFNGFGYIGSTVFVLPGVKGLRPNGRNENETLKSVLLTNTECKTTTFSSSANGEYELLANQTGVYYNNTNVYNEKENINTTAAFSFHVGSVIVSSGVIQSFNIDSVFHAANDSNVVHKTGNEKIYGIKTFIGEDFRVEKERGSIATNYYTDIMVLLDGSRKGVIRTALSDDGSMASILLGSCGPNSEAPNGVKVERTSSHTIVSVPETPGTNANNKEVATTQFVKNYVRLVNVLPASPDSNVFYAIPE